MMSAGVLHEQPSLGRAVELDLQPARLGQFDHIDLAIRTGAKIHDRREAVVPLAVSPRDRAPGRLLHDTFTGGAGSSR
jgi:hypothetical protein